MKKMVAKLSFSSVLVAVMAALILTNTGCNIRERRVARTQRAINAVTSMIDRTQRLMGEGKYDEALAMVEEKIADREYRFQMHRILEQKVVILIAQGNTSEAVSTIATLWKPRPELALSLSERLYWHLKESDKHEEGIAWAKGLLSSIPRITPQMRSQISGWIINLAAASDDLASARMAVDQIATHVKPPEQAASSLQSNLDHLISLKKGEMLKELLDHITVNYQTTPFKRAVVNVRLNSVIATKDWLNFHDAFVAIVAELPDEQLLPSIRHCFATLRNNKQYALMEKSSKTVAFEAANKTNSANLAARHWIECIFNTKRTTLPESLNSLLECGIAPCEIGSLFDHYFYSTIENTNLVSRLCTVGEAILTKCSDTNIVNDVKLKLLDGSFITENYDLSVQMLEAGIPGKDQHWHDMALPKVKAHRALAHNDPREAVNCFRTYMEHWAASDQQEEYDPTTGVAYSKEWILGRNAKRISEILKTIPDAEAAAKALEEARGYFRTAISKVENDPEAERLLKEETADLGL